MTSVFKYLSDLNFYTSHLEEWQVLFKHYQNGKIKKGQFAVAGIFMKGCLPKFFPICKPLKKHFHAEKKLIQLIDDFLKDLPLNTARAGGCILIYTFNSPCIKRNEPGHDHPCLFLISDKSYEWQNKYNLSTEVAFSKYWGPISRTMWEDFNRLEDYTCGEESGMQACLNDVLASFFMKCPWLILGSNCPLNCYVTDEL